MNCDTDKIMKYEQNKNKTKEILEFINNPKYETESRTRLANLMIDYMVKRINNIRIITTILLHIN